MGASDDLFWAHNSHFEEKTAILELKITILKPGMTILGCEHRFGAWNAHLVHLNPFEARKAILGYSIVGSTIFGARNDHFETRITLNKGTLRLGLSLRYGHFEAWNDHFEARNGPF